MALSEGKPRSPTVIPSQGDSHRQSESVKHAYSIIKPKDEDGYDRTTATSPLHDEQHKSISEQSTQPFPPTAASQLLHRRSGMFRNWWQEISASIISLAVLLALFATLYVYADKPSPQWPESISINTIVSLYIVLLKACVILVMANGLGQLKWVGLSGTQARQLSDLVVYDAASRGTVGALSLLWKVNLSHILSSLGALVTILALATEPFAQQIIRYRDCSVPTSQGTASLPRTNYYTEAGIHTGAIQETLVAGVVDAIYAGIYNPSSTPSDVHCPTTNCTWLTEYSSVGWCSSCTDVTHELSFNNVTFVQHSDIDGYNQTETLWNLTSSLPGGLQVDVTGTGTGLWEFAAMGLPPCFADSNCTGSVGIEFLLGKVPNGPLDPSTGNPWPGCTAADKQTTWPCQGYGASRCSLNPCVKTYIASATQGVLTESVVGTAHQWGFGDIGFSMLDITCVSTEDRQKLTNDGYDLKGG